MHNTRINVGIKAMKIILRDDFPERFIIEFFTDRFEGKEKKIFFYNVSTEKLHFEVLNAMIII